MAVSYADSSLAEKELNWKATKNLDDMCRDLWRWQSNNPSGFRNISEDEYFYEPKEVLKSV